LFDRMKSSVKNAKSVMLALGALGMLLLLLVVDINPKDTGYTQIINNKIRREDIIEGWDLYRKRLDEMKNQCKLLPSHIPQYSLKSVYSQFIYAKPHNLVYCPINKVATSTWFDNILVLAGFKNTTDMEHKRKMVRMKLWKFSKSKSKYKKQLQKSLKFFIVRHPFDRLLSCYRDKMLYEEYKGKFPTIQQETALKYPDPIQPSPITNGITVFKNDQANQNNSQALWIHPTFTQFLYFVRDDMKQLWQSNGDYKINPHWAPYWVICAPCQVKFDVLAHLETIDQDNSFVMHETGIQHLLNLTHLHDAKYDNFSSTALAKQHYFSQVPRSLLREIERLYHPDMALFGYSAKPYLDMALQDL
ncbi:unnamed protein product, partial [Meganyctiphanes norvegica]